jgi:hypothetical protein
MAPPADARSGAVALTTEMPLPIMSLHALLGSQKGWTSA